MSIFFSWLYISMKYCTFLLLHRYRDCHFYATKVSILRKTLGHFAVIYMATKNRYYNQHHDLFLTQTKWIWCPNLTKPQSQCVINETEWFVQCQHIQYSVKRVRHASQDDSTSGDDHKMLHIQWMFRCFTGWEKILACRWWLWFYLLTIYIYI